MVRSAVVGAPMTDTKAHAADTSDTPAQPPAPPGPYDSDFAPVIRSKIQPPPLRSTTLTRQRLIDRLHEATQSRVTLLVAEAGYGKTTLLADFAARSGQRTLWYRLDPTDADPITWTNYLIAACREVDPTFGAASLRLLAQSIAGNVPTPAFLKTFTTELAAWSPAPTLLVLDDFHRVDRMAEASQVIHRLIEAAPPWLHIVVSTRRRPPLELARLTAEGELSELGSEDLRFSDSETARLFADGYGIALDDDIVRAIDQRTRGWAASLALLHSTLRNKSAEDAMMLTRELSGAAKPIYDFLAEEVLAAVPSDVELLLMRASILDSVNVEEGWALSAQDPDRHTKTDVRALLEEAEELGLLSRTSRSSDRREMHPLLREFLYHRFKERFGDEAARDAHRNVAAALSRVDPLGASRQYFQAGDLELAMSNLESSILMTIGSGRWGLASELIDSLRDVPPGPGVAAIRARQLMDDGDLVGAERILDSVNTEHAMAPVRSVLRQAKLSLGWRIGRPDMVRSAAKELLLDEETPAPVKEIAQLFVDTDVDGHSPPFALLARRLVRMSETHLAHGLDFYSAVALHNASAFYLGAGDWEASIEAARKSLMTFARLHLQATEASSTHAVMAEALMEAGRDREAALSVTASMDGGRELADVPAAIAIAYLATGRMEEAGRLLARAQTLKNQGRSDIAGAEVLAIAEAFALMAENPGLAISLLNSAPAHDQFDPSLSLVRRVMLAHAHLAAGDKSSAEKIAAAGLEQSRRLGARRSEVRLLLLLALATEDSSLLVKAVRDAGVESRLALPELADVLCPRLDLCDPGTSEIATAVEAHPRRWLPLLRQALGNGAPSGDSAARLIDAHGEPRDVALLRAYARTYRARGASPRLGDALSLRTSPRLRVRDLGRVILEVGERSVGLASMRRKPSALLMYLVSRPAFSSHRDQVLDDLWPDADPASAINSLNQSLYFLRREIDPWYEDGQSPDYIGFAGDLVWLNADLVRSDSAEFLGALQKWKPGSAAETLEVLSRYSGHFAPEFEYEEWALSYRSKLKAKFLEIATSSISRMIRTRDLEGARSIALLALEVDDTPSDIERALIWLHWRLGARSAARAQFEHLMRIDERDGLQPEPLSDLVEGPAPLGAQ